MDVKPLELKAKLPTIARTKNSSIMFLLGLLPLLTFFVDGDSFNVYSIWPAVILLMISLRKIVFNATLIISGAIFISLSLSLVANWNYLFRGISINFLPIIRLLALCEALLFYYLSTQNRYRVSEVVKLLSWTTVSGVIIAADIIYGFITKGFTGKMSAYSVFGVYLEENYTASLQAIIFFAALFLQYLNKKIKVVWTLAMGIIVFSVILTGCRAAVIGILVGLLTFLFILFWKGKIKYMILSLIVIFFAAYIFYQYMPEWTFNRLFIKPYDDKSNQDRLSIWKDAILGWIDSPIIGYGVGNYRNANTNNTSINSHNTYLTFLLDGGIIYFCLITGLIVNGMRALFKRRNIFLALFVCWFIVTFIVESNRMVFFWYGLTLMTILGNSVEDDPLRINAKKGANNNERI